MHATYTFNFLETISKQLYEQLSNLPATVLDQKQITTLRQSQVKGKSRQGVYVITYGGNPVYVGKADNIADRLTQHFTKLSGRKNIKLSQVGYKALYLDKSMSTAANEKVLIKLFKRTHTNLWNGKGFGPKDPGQNRDSTEPGYFDKTYPIREDYPLIDVKDCETLGSTLSKMKTQLPYIVRFDVSNRESDKIDLTGVKRDAKSLLQAIVKKLGTGWKGAILSYGMIVYETDKKYPPGSEILP